MASPTAMPVDSTLGSNGGDDSMATVTNEMGALSTDEGVSRKIVVWDAKAAERATSMASSEMENTPGPRALAGSIWLEMLQPLYAGEALLGI